MFAVKPRLFSTLKDVVSTAQFIPKLTSFPRHLKVAVLGASGVGKSTLIAHYNSGKYDSHIAPTYGLQVSTISFQSCIATRNAPVEISFWDVSGEEQFTHLYNTYLQDADAAFIVTDFRLNSLRIQRNIQNNMTMLLKKKTAPVISIVNKNDTASSYLKRAEAIKLCGDPIFISAKTGENMHLPILKLFERVFPSN